MPEQRFDSYIICTSPRSGSTMLCKLLAATMVAGNPGSLFHKPSIDAWLEYFDLDASAFSSRRGLLEGIFSAAKARGKGETEVFGLRLQRGSFAFFMEQLGFLHPARQTDLQLIEAEFGQTLFIHLSREDKLNQAISYIRAEQTGLWHRRADGSVLERQEPRRGDGYDPDAIRAQLDEFTSFDAAWRLWFEEQAIRPLKVSYESLAREPQAELAKVLNSLGADGSIARNVTIQTAKIADETNREWRARFELDFAQSGYKASL